MSDLKQKRTNDSLQGGEGDGGGAYGEDPRDFGEGGQVNSRALDTGHDDTPDRETGRDPTVNPDQNDEETRNR